MDIATALLAFSFAAALLTLTPGLDTALVLRTAAVEGGRPAFQAGLGISTGSVLWGAMAGLGLGAVLAVSELAYTILQFAGTIYLFYLGIGLLANAVRGGAPGLAAPAGPSVSGSGNGSANGLANWFLRGLMTNLLNPKVGVFYVSFLPQFMPAGVNVPLMSVIMASIHAVMGIAWFAALILATRPLSRLLRRPGVARGLDALTGGILIAFGLRLALEKRLG
ncbi:threonine/homoserine/homoserine lactone efflux protein [Angulomicrobium tetraedrale]|uniref:Threonine/homoserine/homoserine lactone efflux protein n=1 Tax=Ancylobacter tetraedralis TaxID=217068 RepID=A0A839Z9J9_9HYPH|nr:LysE family translocator [Ancylobacter tetraedralis]MBB3771157.1 threonine/homoserine/homoserine lactone efflux protein [Ancylobacter tetraedralis]